MSKVRKISKRHWLFAGVVAAALAVGIIGFVLLPEALVTQLSFDGSPSSRMPKTVFLPLAFALIATAPRCTRSRTHSAGGGCASR